MNKPRFECHYCGAAFPDLNGLVEHFEAVHRNEEYIVKEFPADGEGMPIIEEVVKNGGRL